MGRELVTESDGVSSREFVFHARIEFVGRVLGMAACRVQRAKPIEFVTDQKVAAHQAQPHEVLRVAQCGWRFNALFRGRLRFGGGDRFAATP